MFFCNLDTETACENGPVQVHLIHFRSLCENMVPLLSLHFQSEMNTPDLTVYNI